MEICRGPILPGGREVSAPFFVTMMTKRTKDETEERRRERDLKEKQGKLKRPDFGDENSPKNPEAKPIRHKQES
jgi:hypothetical protein